MARHPGTADGGRPAAAIRGLALTALAAASLLAADVRAGPADLPPWDPTGAQAASEPPAPAPASAPATHAPAPAAAAGPGAPATIPPAALSDELPPPPRDPGDAAFMRPPNNQFQGLPPRTRPDIRRGWSARRRFAVTISPAFAQLRFNFAGRLAPPDNRYYKRLPGAGFNLELDAQIWRWIWVRAQGTYSGHPVEEERTQNSDMDVMTTAPRGTIHALGFGAGPVFALDLGRWLPLIEVGLGGLRVASPRSEIKGQRGAACGDNGACDVGLKCSAANVCEPTIMPDLYFGAAIDLMVRRHLAIGAQFRYYSRLARGEITDFPKYLVATIRLSVRF